MIVTRQPRHTGGCECGAIRYECSAAPIVMFNCHCRECQRVTGGPYTPVVLVPAEAFRLTRGALRHHFTPSEMMGRHKRGFCGDCGSRVTGHLQKLRGRRARLLPRLRNTPSPSVI